MAKSTVKVSDPDEEIESRAERMAALNEAEGGDLFASIDEISATAGVEVMIIRTSPADNAGYCGTMPVSEFSIATLKKEYGPGKYKIRIKGPTGFLPGGGSVSVAKDPDRPQSNAQDFQTFQEWQAKRDADSSERRSRMLEMVLPSAITGAIGLLTAMATRQTGPDVATLITALKPAPAPGLAELTTSLASLQALSKPADSASALDSIVKVMDVVKDFGGDSGGKTGWLDIVKELINQAGPAVKPILEGLQAQTAARNASMQGNPAVSVQVEPAPAVIAKTPPPVSAPDAETGFAGSAVNYASEEEKMMALFGPMIRDALAQIAKWAEADKSPELYAEVFLDNLPLNIETYLPREKALEYIDHEKWFEKISDIESRLKNHKKWCEEFRDELKSLINSEEEEKPDTDESGNFGGDTTEVSDDPA